MPHDLAHAENIYSEFFSHSPAAAHAAHWVAESAHGAGAATATVRHSRAQTRMHGRAVSAIMVPEFGLPSSLLSGCACNHAAYPGSLGPGYGCMTMNYRSR